MSSLPKNTSENPVQLLQWFILGLDPDTEDMAPFFHPYKQCWNDHFTWQDQDLLIVGLTPIGRATVNVLKLNRSPLIKARHFWIQAGRHPPDR